MRKLFGTLCFLVIIAVGLGTLAWLNIAYLLAKGISSKTRASVTIEAVRFHKNALIAHNFQMANPKGARLPTALKVETIGVRAPYTNYLKNPIVIDEIYLDNLYVNIQIYNKSQTEGNWHTIIQNVSQDNESPFSIKRKALIKKLRLVNIRIDLILSDGKLRQLSPIQKLEFENITTEKGIPIQEISEIIVEKMIQSIFLEKGLKGIIEAPANIIKGIFPFFGQVSPFNIRPINPFISLYPDQLPK